MRRFGFLCILLGLILILIAAFARADDAELKKYLTDAWWWSFSYEDKATGIMTEVRDTSIFYADGTFKEEKRLISEAGETSYTAVGRWDVTDGALRLTYSHVDESKGGDVNQQEIMTRAGFVNGSFDVIKQDENNWTTPLLTNVVFQRSSSPNDLPNDHPQEGLEGGEQ
jgi:hypothetical protein